MYNEELKTSVKETIISLAIKKYKRGPDYTFMAKPLIKFLLNELKLPQTDLNLVLKELINEKFLKGKYMSLLIY